MTQAVTDITTAIADASVQGKELHLTQEQQAILQKHELLVKQYQQKMAVHQQQTQQALMSKNKQNYRLLGRNIFDNQTKPQFKQPFFKVFI